MAKYLVECIGTFFLVLTVSLAVGYAGALAPIAIGAALMVMVYAGGHISGAHYNPAVTLGLRVSGSITTHTMLSYRISQFVGGIAGAAVALIFLGEPFVLATNTFTPIQVLLAEFLFTFALVYVVHMVAVAPSVQENSYFGLAIGFIVMTGAFTVGSISGGAFNPAVVVGGYINGLFSLTTSRPQWIGILLGAIAAGATYSVISKNTD